MSNSTIAQENAYKYLGNTGKLYKSTRSNKKFAVKDPTTNKLVHFGDSRYDDYTKTGDKVKRYNYLKRASNIKGDWKSNKYSPNNLSIHILWG